VRVLIAPSAFAGTLSAVEVAAAISDGWSRTSPADALDAFPVSGGGPGLVDVVHARLGGQLLGLSVTSADGATRVPAVVLLTADAGDGPTAWIEAAQACPAPARDRGPTRLRLDTTTASGGPAVGSGGPAVGSGGPAVGSGLGPTVGPATSRGVGELVAAAVDAGARTLVVGTDGARVTDAGAGLLEVLGGGASAASVEAAAARLAGVRLVAVGSSDEPLGEDAESREFADRLTATLGQRAPREEPPVHPELAGLGEHARAAHPARRSGPDASDAGVRPQPRPRPLVLAPRVDRPLPARAGAGAGGGLGFALLAIGARYRSGIAEVLRATGFAAAVAAADLVVTGEGSFDHESRAGSAVGGVLAAAGDAGVAGVVLAGRSLLGSRETRALGAASVYAIQDLAGWDGRSPAADLARLAERVARTWARH